MRQLSQKLPQQRNIVFVRAAEIYLSIFLPCIFCPFPLKCACRPPADPERAMGDMGERPPGGIGGSPESMLAVVIIMSG